MNRFNFLKLRLPNFSPNPENNNHPTEVALSPIQTLGILQQLKPTKMVEKGGNIRLNLYELVKQMCLVEAVETLFVFVQSHLTTENEAIASVNQFLDTRLFKQYRTELDILMDAFGAKPRSESIFANFYYIYRLSYISDK